LAPCACAKPRIVTSVYRPKRTPRKRKAVAIVGPAIVTTASRKRLHRAEREALPDDPEADARVKAFRARMIRPR
jgi:hypothetical protein